MPTLHPAFADGDTSTILRMAPVMRAADKAARDAYSHHMMDAFQNDPAFATAIAAAVDTAMRLAPEDRHPKIHAIISLRERCDGMLSLYAAKQLVDAVVEYLD